MFPGKKTKCWTRLPIRVQKFLNKNQHLQLSSHRDVCGYSDSLISQLLSLTYSVRSYEFNDWRFVKKKNCVESLNLQHTYIS